MTWVGKSVERVEDGALLTGHGRYIDDLGVKPGTLHAAILRSSQAHADIISIDTTAAHQSPGVAAVITGADLAEITSALVASVRAPIDARAIATDRVRYVGEPVAVAIASDRYRAEDALDLIDVAYRSRPAIVDPVAALAPDAPLLHDAVGSNLTSDRRFTYGEPDAAFAAAAHRITLTTRYPRNTGSPMETYGVVAEYDPHENAYDILANFQGPFSIHAVIARALKVPGNRLRLRLPPDSGGSFGVKQGVAPYIVLIAAAARLIGRPGQVDRGPARASLRRRLGHEPRDDAHRRCGARWPHHRAGLGPARRLRRLLARPGASHALPDARQPHGRL